MNPNINMNLTIGILQCDSVLEPFQPEFGNYPEMFQLLMRRINPDLAFRVYDVQKLELPTDINECDSYITTGSRHSISENLDWIQALEQFLQRLNAVKKKCVGVCFGHQLIVRMLGGMVEKSPRGWGIGIGHYPLLARASWMQPPQDSLAVVVSHQDQVSSLPKGMQVLAGNDFCPYFMLQYQQHFITVQGHPEFSREYSSRLIHHRRKQIPPERVARALTSLEKPADDELLMGWIVRFLYAE